MDNRTFEVCIFSIPRVLTCDIATSLTGSRCGIPS